MNEVLCDELPLNEEVEVAPGLIVQRRSFLALAAGIVVATGAAAHGQAVEKRGQTGSLSLAEFFALANPLSKELVVDTSRAGQDRYLLALAAIAVRLGDVPVPEMRSNTVGAGPRTFIGDNPGGESFVVLHWRMEPGAVIGFHPHTYGNVVTLVLDGEARIGNFEQVGELDLEAKGTFRVRQTCDQIVSAGGTNLVSLERNYIHGFQAGPKGARGLDITTRIKEKRATPSLQIAQEPLDRAQGIWEASWVG